MAEASCPASCGELIQGWIDGSEKLVSCPVDWFSTIEVVQGNARLSHERPLMRRALELALDSLHIPLTESQDLVIHSDSSIPLAKGMASSTADIAATIAATYRHYACGLTEQKLAALCTRLEPTDSTLFSALTLFDHNQGTIYEQFGQLNNLNVLILESPVRLPTAAYHRLDRQPQLLASSPVLNRAARQLAQSVTTQNMTLAGQAATASAIESQRILIKPCFQDLLQLVEKHDLYGLNVAHSGTVVGLLHHTARHDIDSVIADIRHSPVNDIYPVLHHRRIIKGGVR